MNNSSLPSIFNDVLGPVMRGPSSSHTAGSYRIGLLLRDLVGDTNFSASFYFHPEGSLATTYHTQGSDLGLAAGLAGLDIVEPEMIDALELAKRQGIDISFHITDYPASHPNTYKCTLQDSAGRTCSAIALSTGGGMIKVVDLMGFPVDFQGDDTVLFVIFRETSDLQVQQWMEEVLSGIPGYTGCSLARTNKRVAGLYRFSGLPDLSEQAPLFTDYLEFFRVLKPVMPVPAMTAAELPFRSLTELLHMPDLIKQQAGELARSFESVRSGISIAALDRMMDGLITIWRQGIANGLGGTSYDDRLIGAQSPEYMKRYLGGQLIEAGPLNRMIAYSTALMETKSSMGVIIAAPTAGACGGLPGCLIGLSDHLNMPEKLMSGFWAAGLVGLFIAMEATFAAEVAGCQAETGAGAAMAAAGLVEMMGGTAQQAFDAASIALQNVMGLVCDPVANRVEIPCLGRNAGAAGNALTAANMVLGGISAVIPLDETIRTMLAVGHAMPASLRCTALGGLSDTPTARRMEAAINAPRQSEKP